MTLRAILWLAVSTEAQADDDKNSLQSQERDARAAAESNGWEIIDMLSVPGHSRRYIDIHEMNRDMLAQGIDAVDKMLRHWEKADFDVLVVRDGSRFARTQSIHSYFVERTVHIDARIYSLADGWIDKTNHRMWISMGGYASAGEIDNLVKRRQIGFEARIKKGLPPNHSVPMSHKIVRDPNTGKATHVEVDETKRQMLDDLATLILEGLPWRQIETEIFERYGHGNELGEPFSSQTFHRMLYTPAVWGHIARYFKHESRGAWAYEEGEPVPDGVEIDYNVWPAAWDDETANRLKAELKRRSVVSKGKSSPHKTKAFSGLLICGECGYNLTYAKKDSWEAYRCMTRWEQSPLRTVCEQTKNINIKKVRTYIDNRLKEMISAGDPEAFFPTSPKQPQNHRNQLAEIEKEAANIENEVKRLILDKTRTDDENIRRIYDETIQTHSKKLKSLQNRERELKQVIAQENTDIQRRAYEDILALSVDGFWKLDDKKINQLLHRLMGRKRFVVMDGVIRGVVDAPVHERRYSGR